jgi:hypothetical protein
MKSYDVQLTNGKFAYQLESSYVVSYVDISREVIHDRPDLFFFPLVQMEPFYDQRGLLFLKGLILENSGIRGQFKRLGIFTINSFNSNLEWMRFEPPNWIEKVKGKVQQLGRKTSNFGEMNGHHRIISII